MFNWLFDYQKRYLKKIKPIIEKINSLEAKFEKLSNLEIKDTTSKFKERIANGESLDDLLPEIFALVRESSKRTLGQRHFDVQMIAGVAMHQGKIAQMLTGEGKTLAATLPAFLNCLTGKGVHIVTVNDYLAQRDAVWMGQIYDALGAKVACLVHEAAFLYDPKYQKERLEELDKERDLLGGFKVIKSFLKPVSRKEAYRADIIYGTNHEFGFDYLREHMVYDLNQEIQRDLYFAIIDEIDSILIDEARTPLIITQPDVKSSKYYQEFAKIVAYLKEDQDYEIDEKLRSVSITPKGLRKVEKMLGVDNLYSFKNFHLVHYLDEALRAYALFKKDRDYVVKNNEVIIVDEFTGRLMYGRRFSGGLHQAIEAKEGLVPKAEAKILGTITLQNYFKKYQKLAGMTGTAIQAAEEFDKIYNLDVICIPPNKPMIRVDLPDLVFLTKEIKFKKIVEKIKECFEKGQPVLVGTRSIEVNEHLSWLLSQSGIPHQVLNAKNHEKEGAIIAQAGKKGAITVATNMAGRGVDIILGGNPPDPKEAEEIKKLGGLFVLGTERHESRRIDDQLRGRSGRQGDPGTTQFYLSLEDDLLRIFGGEKIKNLVKKLNLPEEEPISSRFITKVIEEAQKKVEGMNFDIRKHTLEYDQVLELQREAFYKKRKEILKETNFFEFLEKIIKKISQNLESYFPSKETLTNFLVNLGIEEKGNNNLKGFILEFFEKKFQSIEDINQKIKIISLSILDFLWSKHLEDLEALKESVRIRAYGAKDPLSEYKIEAKKLWQGFFDNFEFLLFQAFFGLKENDTEIFTETKNSPQISYQPKGKKKIGRNDPCPCGSGKKYKHCCGRNEA
ncbi:preprotein translocase subunit SecA [bacterium]|nr:preprotein translocase subunit SecA [bacterium]